MYKYVASLTKFQISEIFQTLLHLEELEFGMEYWIWSTLTCIESGAPNAYIQLCFRPYHNLDIIVFSFLFFLFLIYVGNRCQLDFIYTADELYTNLFCMHA